MYKVNCNQAWWFSRLGVDSGEYILGPMPLAQALTQNAVGEVENLQRKVVPGVLPSNVLSGDTIYLVRPGSFGDLLLLTPTVKALRLRYPGVAVKVVCHPRYAPILNGVVDTVGYPVKFEDYQQPSNHYFFLEGVLEHPDKELAGYTYATRFARACGLDRLDDRKVLYVLTADEMAWAEDSFPKESGKIRVGVQVRASAENRTYHRKRTVEVMAHLLRNRVADEIYLFGAPGDIDVAWGKADNLVNLSEKGLSVRMSVAVAKTCDVMLVPDSLFMHVAGALDIPALVLSGAFDPSLTQGDQKTVQAMKGMGPCRFCNYLPVGGNPFPPGKKCAVELQCSVLNSLSPEIVAHNLKNILHGKRI